MKIKVNGQNINIADRCIMELTSNAVNLYTAEFTFDAAWDGFEKVAVFQFGNRKPVEMYLTDDKCDVPHEVLIGKGQLKIGVYGTKGDVTMPTIWGELINIDAGTPTDGSESKPPTPSIVQQILDAINEGKVKGEPGRGIESVSAVNMTDQGFTLRFVLTDFTVYDYEIKNGKAGKDGKDGKDGTDYIITEADYDAIAQIVSGKIDLSEYAKKVDLAGLAKATLDAVNNVDSKADGIAADLKQTKATLSALEGTVEGKADASEVELLKAENEQLKSALAENKMVDDAR